MGFGFRLWRVQGGRIESIAIIMWACRLPNKAIAKASLLQTGNAARVVHATHIYPPSYTLCHTHVPYTRSQSQLHNNLHYRRVGVRQLLIIAPDRRRPFCNTPAAPATCNPSRLHFT